MVKHNYAVTHTDFVQKLSNVKRMDVENIIRTVLEKNPGIKAKFLIPVLQKKTGLSRSTLYELLGSLEIRGQIFREKGRYWVEKPKKGGSFFKDVLDWGERRAVRKRRDKDREMRELMAEREARNEIINLDETEWSQEKEWEIKKKWRKQYALD